MVLGSVLLFFVPIRIPGCRNLDNNIGWFANNLSLESLLGISGVTDGSQKTITIYDRVAALDHAIVAGLLAVLVVGELVILDVKSKLV